MKGPFAVLLAVATLVAPPAFAQEVVPVSRADVPPAAGRPRVTLDLLDLSRAPLAQPEEEWLRGVLAREAKLASWGAGRGARIQYRFRVEELTLTEEKGVLRARCAARGFLPRGKNAGSQVSFGGAPGNPGALVRHVLEIVARGVITRLADLERRRRGA